MFSFGHSSVVFSLHVPFPFALGKIWALPNLIPPLLRREHRNRHQDAKAF